jgi:magnesium transporter
MEQPPLAIMVRRPDASVRTLGIEQVDRIDELRAEAGTLVWVSAAAPDEELLVDLAREFEIHPVALEDVRKRGQRPKLDSYGEQHMVVAYEVGGDESDDLSEIHLFAGPGWLLSVHWTTTPMIDGVRRRFERAGDNAPASVGQLLYALLDGAVDSYFPELDTISDRIDALEDRILEGVADRESLAEVLSLKRRLLELRRVLAPTRDLANALLRRDVAIVEAAALPYYQDLYDHLVRVLDQLDIYRDLLATVLDARLTVASNNLNAIMKRLTAITVILMVPTLIAGIYGMNFDVMPELDWVLGYPFALALMLIAAGTAFTWFRRSDWF